MFFFRAYFFESGVYINAKQKYAANKILTAYLNTDYADEINKEQLIQELKHFCDKLIISADMRTSVETIRSGKSTTAQAHYARYMKKKRRVAAFEAWSRYAVELIEKANAGEMKLEIYRKKSENKYDFYVILR